MNHQFLENYNSLHNSQSKECSDPDDRMLYELTNVAPPDSIDTDGAWNVFVDSLESSNSVPKGLSISLPALLRTAAVLFIVSAVGVFSFLYVSSSETYDVATVTNMGNEQQLVHLSDGSQVWLGKNSEIQYPANFKSSRKITLKGEAYFDVAEDQGRFIISTNSAIIEVLGTEFNVRNNGSESVHVIVTEGLVSLGNGEVSDQIAAGQEGILNISDNKILIGSNPDLNGISWKTGEFIFNEIGLEDALAYFNKYYGMEVKLGSASLSKCKVSGSFKKMTLEEVLHELSLVLSLKVEKEQNSYLLTGKGC